MPVESAADRLSFFNTDEFGVAATYGLANGSMVNVQGIFDSEFQEIVEDQFGAGVATHPPRFLMRENDLPGGYGDGDHLVVSGVTYHIRTHERDGTGMVALRLEA